MRTVVPRRALVAVVLVLAVGLSACGSDGDDVATRSAAPRQAQVSRPDPVPFLDVVRRLPYFASARVAGPVPLGRLVEGATGTVTGTFEEVRVGEETTIRARDLVDVANESQLPYADNELITSNAELLVRVDGAPGVVGVSAGEVVAVPIPLDMRPVGLLGPTPEEMVAALQDVSPVGARVMVIVADAGLPGVPTDDVGVSGTAAVTPPGMDAVVFEGPDGGAVSLNSAAVDQSQEAPAGPRFEAFVDEAEQAVTG